MCDLGLPCGKPECEWTPRPALTDEKKETIKTGRYSSEMKSYPRPSAYVGIKDGMEMLKEKGVKVVRERYKDTPVSHRLMLIQDEKLRDGLVRLYDAYPFFREAPAGAKHHHWWKGGLEQHCQEMIGIGLDLMELYSGDLNSFTKDDLITAVFLHDFSKVFMYRPITAEEREKNPDKFHPKQEFTYTKGATSILDAENLTAVQLMKFGVPVTEKQWSAVVFAEGGYSKANFGFGGATKTSDTVNHANPLASFMAMLDSYSAIFLGNELQ